VTTATWMRNFIRAHPEYKHDSVVGPGITYDLIRTVDAVEKGKQRADNLLGKEYSPSCIPCMCQGADLSTMLGLGK
jgi:glutamate--cysteine ligase catalytic subunit